MTAYQYHPELFGPMPGILTELNREPDPDEMVDLYAVIRFSTLDGYDEQSEFIGRLTRPDADEHIRTDASQLATGWEYRTYTVYVP